ncbi:MAG: alpha-2-macroglobulin [Spirochaetia bacterium]|nr:alpha-2-macroglobulin [Spirochaetia bacterium]
MKRLFPALTFILIGAAHVLIAQNPASIQTFSPQGTVKEIRQVRAQFSEAMVPFGYLKQPVKPFETNCSNLGTERWADEKNWLFDFKDELPAGVVCKFTLTSGIKSLSGRDISGQRSFEFSTGGPSIVSTQPWEGSTIAEDQIFILRVDAPVDEASLTGSMSFNVDGLRERIGVRIVTGSDRETILKRQYMNREAAKDAILVQARQTFPAGKKVQLVWGKNIKSKSGVAGTQDQLLDYDVRTDFTATFNCERENAQADCIPLLPMYVSFSAPISREDAKKIVLNNDDRQWKVNLPEGDTESSLSTVSIPGPFPDLAEFRIELPAGLKDDAGRPLANSKTFPLKVRTAEYPPLAKFAAPFGILELREGGLLPVTLRNIEAPVPVQMYQPGAEGMQGRKIRLTPENADQVLLWMRKIYNHNRARSIFADSQGVKVSDLRLPRPNGSKAFEVIGIPLGGPGFYVLELESKILGKSLLGKEKSLYVPAAALVTNLAVHLKWGRESSLVWVTALDTGKPVEKATVTARTCDGTVVWTGQTDGEGIAPANLPSEANVKSCNKKPFSSGLLVTAQVGDDLSIVHSEWNDGIESWRFNLPYGTSNASAIGHTVFARTLLRAGDALHMKHIMRRHQMSGFGEVANADLPTKAVVTHVGSGQNFEFPISWQGGAAETTWRIPQDAKLGEYSVALNRSGKAYSGWSTGAFQVEEFRVPLMRGVIKSPSEQVVRASSFPVDVALSYLSGGGASAANVRFRYAIKAGGYPEFRDYEDFTFANGTVKEGTVQAEGEYNYDEEAPEVARTKIKSQDVTLDKAGTARVNVSEIPASEATQNVETEMEFRDPNGVIQTVSRTVQVYPSVHFLGIKQDSWIVSKDNLKFQVMVVDLKGAPVAGTDVRVDAFERKTFSHRKRLVGGYYAYDNMVETKKIDKLCSGTSDARGLVLCQSKINRSGNIILAATAKDSQGTAIAANREIWVAGNDAWWFRPDEGDRMDVIPEKKRYEPGETARLQVRMPFSKATALVTVEREGIIEKFVQEISGKEPVVSVPIRGNYAPNAFVSVMVVRGRAGDIKPTALVDLGKPSYRLGIAHLTVGYKAHELNVKVTPDTETYRIRGKARIQISVRTANGQAPGAGSEVALAAVDEGLLELKPNTSWNLISAMMGVRGLEVNNSTAQMQVVGRRHFGLKAMPPGGGGGKQMTRELFDTLLLWKGRVKLDASGNATVDIPLNDSLTSFKIVAVATAGNAQFGTGQTSIRTTQDLMLLPGVPPLARQGDSFKAEFTLRNTTTRSMEVELNAITTVIPESGSKPTLPAQKIRLGPGEAREVNWDVTVPIGVSGLVYDVTANETGADPARAMEKLKITQKVIEAIPVRTYQATLEQIDKEYKLNVERPADSIPGRGSVNVNLSPSLLGSLESVREYMRRYPYNCMEQMTSRAIVLRDKKMWDQLMERLPLYLDSEGFVKFFPEMTEGSDTLTAYMLAISNEAGYSIPPESREKMIGAMRNFVTGKISRTYRLNATDLGLRKLTSIEALSRYGEAKPEMLSSIQIQPNLWPTSAVLDYLNILKRTPEISQAAQKKSEVEQTLRARLSFQGTTLGFSSESTDYLWWLCTSIDTNAVKLILSTSDSPGWKADLPRIVRGALQRQKKGAWDLTLANAWGVLALEKFANEFERTTVGGTTTATLTSSQQTLDWAKNRSGDMNFQWPQGRNDLSIKHQGAGKPWALIQSRAAVPLKTDLSAGYRVQKTLKPVEQKKPGSWSRGDLVRITLKIKADADRTWVVVSDPIPAGASILGTGLARESGLLQEGERREGWVWPAYEERSFEAFRAYYEYAAQGEWTVEYTLRLNQAGTFILPQTRVEAMYSPEMFGETPNAILTVVP